MHTSTSLRWLVVALSAAMLLAVAAACSSETIEVPGETVVVEKEVVKEVMVPGETVVVEKEVVKTVEVPGETVVVEKEVVKTVAGPERVVVKEVYRLLEEPQYGGTITEAERASGAWDPWDRRGEFQWGMYMEQLSSVDWTADRDVAPMVAQYFPLEAAAGSLAESWELPDSETIIFHIRKGVHWHDKAPANGREMTAEDVEYTFHRLMGWSEKYGFTEPSSHASGWLDLGLKSVEATDKSTVVVKYERNLHFLKNILFYKRNHIVNRETVEKYGDLKDWKNAVGTGPFMVEDFVEGSSITYRRNPDYWGRYEYDPQYQLPFVDKSVKFLIEDRGTLLAGVRTGKIDVQLKMSIDEWKSLLNTNAQIQYLPFNKEGHAIGMKWDPEKPWYDIRVRKAMSMAINRPEMAETLYHGLVDWRPYPLIGPNVKGFIVEWEDWPEELRQEYTFNPQRARELLAEAGYGDGFEAEIWIDPGDQPMDMLLSMTSYLDDIGIDLTVIDMTELGFWDKLTGGERGTQGYAPQFEELTFDWSGFSYEPTIPILREQAADGEMAWSGYQREDTQMQKLIPQIMAAKDQEEYQSLVKELYLYYAKQHYRTIGVSFPSLVIWQPWVKGYRGERYIMDSPGPIHARVWIDKP